MINKITHYTQQLIDITLQRPREMGLSILLLVCTLAGIYVSTPPFVKKVFELKIYKNAKPVTKLTDERDISAETTVWVDYLMLKNGYHLVHPKLGNIGFGDNFFIDIDGKFIVKTPGRYFFYPGSDDGFSLAVDDNMLCQFVGDRAYATRSCRIELTEGEHTFALKYFQGGGHAGLTLAYRHEDAKSQKWFGDNSRYLKFH